MDPQEEPEFENQNLQVPENQEDKGKEEIAHRPIFLQLPKELLANIAVRIKKRHYLKISLVSRPFLEVIRSDEFFRLRSSLGLTKRLLYSVITVLPSEPPSWFLLPRRILFPTLTRSNTFPPMLHGSTILTIGFRIYVIGGIGNGSAVATVILIDARFRTWRYLPSMLRARSNPAAGLIDGHIYVIGGLEENIEGWVERLNLSTMMWESVDCPLDCWSSWRGGEVTQCAVMINQIFISDLNCWFAYNPRKNEWRTWGSESLLTSYWREPYCVIDNLLYCINLDSIGENPIRVYNPKKDVWSYVRNVPALPNAYTYSRARLADFGGMLVILASRGDDIWRLEVDLTTREVEGERQIWGYIPLQVRVLGDRVHSMKLCGYVEV